MIQPSTGAVGFHDFQRLATECLRVTLANDSRAINDMTHDARNWEGIEQAYVDGDWSLRRIAEAFGTTEYLIRKRANADGWIRRVGTKPLPSGRKPRAPGAPKAKCATAEERRRRNLVRRLLDVLDKGLMQVEARMAPDAETGGQPPSAADSERDARTLAGLARLYAKLVELDAGAEGGGKAEQGQGALKPEATDDADRLRRDLALRFQRLNQSRGS